jgi:hypothetical protein
LGEDIWQEGEEAMNVADSTLKSVRKGIFRAGRVYISYNGRALKVTRADSSAADRINERHLIGVYNGQSPELDILDDINNFIEQYQQEQAEQSERLTQSMGMVS